MVLLDLDTNISSDRVRSSRFRACLRANLHFLISSLLVSSLIFLSFLSFLLSMRTFSSLLYFTPLFLGITCVQSTTLPPPGQPSEQATLGSFDIIGNSFVSAQQLFLGTPKTVYFIDKVENNPTQVNGHPAWASEWTLGSNSQRALSPITNTFCAGGSVLGNGTWINVGGNQGITYGGQPALSQDGGGPYDDPDGRQSIRMLNPCDDGTCDWTLAPDLIEQRWYPTLETLADGTIIIIGGCTAGGYVNAASQNNPTYEFFPPKGTPITSTILQTTLPANLYPLTWLLPSGNLFIQSNWATVLLNLETFVETPLDNIPDAVRTYPASAATMMLPLTPANNWTATILFCGGSDVQPNEWTAPTFIPPQNPTSSSCVRITPDESSSYVEDDPMPQGVSMSNFIVLPDSTLLNLNGAQLGTAGYGNDSWAIGHSYADDPILLPKIYDPSAPQGQRWSSNSLSASTVPRLYHSSATLLPDGSVFVSGSNPNPDYTVGPGVKYPTEYRTEIFYPLYYNQRRPQPLGLLAQYSYGGPNFIVSLSSADLFGDVNNVKTAKVVIIRTGFATHAINFGQRYVELATSYTAYQANNTAILYVNQLPPNPAIIAPGPALIFVVVNGVPSIGLQVMLGSGQLGQQTLLTPGTLPAQNIVVNVTAPTTQPTQKTSSSCRVSHGSLGWTITGIFFFLLLSHRTPFT